MSSVITDVVRVTDGAFTDQGWFNLFSLSFQPYSGVGVNVKSSILKLKEIQIIYLDYQCFINIPLFPNGFKNLWASGHLALPSEHALDPQWATHPCIPKIYQEIIRDAYFLFIHFNNFSIIILISEKMSPHEILLRSGPTLTFKWPITMQTLLSFI